MMEVTLERTKQLKLCFPADVFQGKHYLSLESFLAFVQEAGFQISCRTLIRYIVDWKKSEKIYSAGRGWFSDIEKPFQLDTMPLQEIVSSLSSKFPLLELSCWSTRQLADYHQHLPLRYCTFVYVDRYAIPDVAKALAEEFPEYSIMKDPSRKEAIEFERREVTIVLRPIIYDDRVEQTSHYLPIEKILVDYAIEAESMMLADGADYKSVFDNVTTCGRVNISTLLRRVAHRKAKAQVNIKMILNQLA